MDLVTAFISIVGLLGVYKDEVRDSNGRDFNAYIDWLRRQEHNNLVELIFSNNDLSRSLRVLIEDQHDEVMAKLAELDKVLSCVAGHIADFGPLANAVRIETGLSDQAVSVLHQLNNANTSRFLEIGMMEGNSYPFLDGNGSMQISEPRFINDDLLTLCELGLLRLSHNNSGGRIFTITREGATVGG